MSSVFLNIHGLCRIRIEGLSRTPFPDMNVRWGFFETAPDGEADIRVRIGRFSPELSGCRSLRHRFFAKRDALYWRDGDKRLAWEARVTGLEDGPMTLDFHPSIRNRLRYPWALFPDLALSLYVLAPLVELVLARRGVSVVHAGAVADGNRGILIAAPGGSFKTTFVMGLVRGGAQFLSDDMCLVRRGRVLSLPTSPGFFDYLVRKRPTEEIAARHLPGLAVSMMRGEPLSFTVADSARLEELLIVTRRTGIRAPRVSEVDPESALESLARVSAMSWFEYVGHGCRVGAFLDGYRYLVPGSSVGEVMARRREILRANIGAPNARRLTVPRQWTHENLGLVRTPAAGGEPRG